MSEKPSSWTVLNEYSKSVITITSALLALAAAMGDRLLIGASVMSRLLFGGAVLLVLISLIAALYVAAKIYRCLRAEEQGEDGTAHHERLRNASNTSYICLGLGLFIIFLLATLPSQSFGLKEASDEALKTVAHVKRLQKTDLSVMSATWDPTSEKYVIIATLKDGQSSFVVSIDPKARRALSLR